MYYHLTLDLELMFKKLRFKEEVGKKIIYWNEISQYGIKKIALTITNIYGIS
jgi:hypothetical protein